MRKTKTPYANNLRRLRTSAILSQAEFAGLSGLTEQTIRQVELGKNRPQAKTRRMVIAALEKALQREVTLYEVFPEEKNIEIEDEAELLALALAVA